jgi:hypothetical protein
VPTLGDLRVMLQVLSRTGTRQQLTVYSNIITAERSTGGRRLRASHTVAQPAVPIPI